MYVNEALGEKYLKNHLGFEEIEYCPSAARSDAGSVSENV